MNEDFRIVANRGIVVMSRHAEARRLKRRVPIDAIHRILTDFNAIEEYPDSFPLPAMLLFGMCEDTPLHIVAGFDLEQEIVYIITVYIPDSEHFEPDWITRRNN
ncbi:MAG: DUF4258 domain-containing protein [Candidatus Hatepunaea meridiana]|nr:DUF4258 domain-containing protein [Candidatus Hatepunaea meridiana]